MTPELYQRLKPLYDAALDLPGAARVTFVAKACGGDFELVRELEALLAAHDEETGTLDRPLVGLKGMLSDSRGIFSPGDLIDKRFRIVRFIGRGGMGHVYEAKDIHLDPGQIALKTVKPEIARDPSVLARFKDEVVLARQVSGLHVCRIYDLHLAETEVAGNANSYLTMEFLEGVTLAARITERGALPVKEVMNLAVQLCAALESVHQAKVVHRDLKPGNIMLVPSDGPERVVVMDFGLAHALQSRPRDVEIGLTRPGMILGTPEYMAPEQFEGREVSAATDIYALGIVLYEMVTGTQPYAAPSPFAAAVRRGRRPDSPSSIRKGIPAVWDDVFWKCIEYEPARRFQSAAEVLAALRQHSLTLWRFPHGRRVAVSRRGAVAAGVIVLATLAIGGWSAYRRTKIHVPPPAAQSWYDLGVSALRDGTYLGAVRALNAAVDADKDFVLARARLADAWSELDFTGRAQQEMLVAASREQQHSVADGDKKYVDAVSATLIRDYSAAAQDYEEILKELPEDQKADGYVDLGRAYEKAGRVKETIDSYRKAAQLRPDDPAPFVHLGIWQSRQRDHAGAEAAFSRAEELYQAKSNQEGLAEVAYQRGYAANQAADSGHARQFLEQSLAIARQIGSPQLEARSLSQLSNVEYDDSNDPKGDDKAIEYANRSIRIAEANNLDYWKADGEVRLANAYLDKGDFTTADSNAQEALHSVDVNDHPRIKAAAQLTLASIRDQLGRNRDEQIAFAQDAWKYYRDYGFLDMAALAAELVVRGQKSEGEFGPALQTAQELLEIANRNGRPFYIEQAEETVGDVYDEIEDYPSALSHYEHALDAGRTAHMNEAYEAVHCASMLWRLGRYDDAERMLSTVSPEARARADIGSYIDENVARIQLSRSLYRDSLATSRKIIIRFPNLSPANMSDCRATIAQSEASLGHLKEAQHDADQLLASAENSKDQGLIALAELVEADVLVKSRLPAKAEDYARSANLYFSEKGQKESQWLSLFYLAEALEASGDATSGAATAKQALDVLAGIQLSWSPAAFQQYTARPDNQAALRTLSEIRDRKG